MNAVWLEKISTKIFEIPFATRNVCLLLFGVYLVELATSIDLVSHVCFEFLSITHKFQFYRLVLYAIFHSGILHFVFNCMTYYSTAYVVEKCIGTLNLLLFMILSMLFTTVFLFAASLLGHALNFGASGCVVGFSGVIFSLIVLEISVANQSTHTLFLGFLPIPTRFYPWFLLVVFQIMMSNVSFLGHLSGLIFGYMFNAGVFNKITPNFDHIEKDWNGFVISGSHLPSSVVDRENHGWSLLTALGRFLAIHIPFLRTNVQENEVERVEHQGNLNASLHVLSEMGFERNVAMGALARNGGDLQRAINELTATE